MNPAGVRGDQLNGDQGWDPDLDGGDEDRFARMDGGDAHSVLTASLLARFGAALGDADLALRGPAERARHVVVLAEERRGRAGVLGTLEGIRIGERPRQLEILPYVLTGEQYAVRRRERSLSRKPRHAHSRGRRPEVSAHVESHARRDLLSGLRPGGGRSRDDQSLARSRRSTTRSARSSSPDRARSALAGSIAISAATRPASTCSTRGASAACRSCRTGCRDNPPSPTRPTTRRSSAPRRSPGERTAATPWGCSMR